LHIYSPEQVQQSGADGLEDGRDVSSDLIYQVGAWLGLWGKTNTIQYNIIIIINELFNTIMINDEIK
jgi:hypothetical protein